VGDGGGDLPKRYGFLSWRVGKCQQDGDAADTRSRRRLTYRGTAQSRPALAGVRVRIRCPLEFYSLHT
jgi:hypothetical protein